MSIIRTENVHYAYEDGTKAINGIDISIDKGEKIVFLGANGSGKSTLFLLMNGIIKPTKGKIYFEERELSYKRRDMLEHRKNVGIVFQEPDNQLILTSVYEEISFGIMNICDSECEARKKVDEIIEELGIENICHKPVHLLSGGQKKRVAIADILVMSPKLIILDEPSASLDPKYTKIVREFIDKMVQRGMTVVLSTHDMDYALEFADRVYVFKYGKVIAQGRPYSVLADEKTIDEANLKMPAAISLYKNLKEKNIIKKECEIRTLYDVEACIEESFRTI